jgi:hypothetical protein
MTLTGIDNIYSIPGRLVRHLSIGVNGSSMTFFAGIEILLGLFDWCDVISGSKIICEIMSQLIILIIFATNRVETIFDAIGTLTVAAEAILGILA